MLTIHFANRTERLAALLGARVGRGALFSADEVIVPSAAVRRQLTLALAERHGVCANVRFDYLAQWLWRLIARVVPGVHAASPFAPGVLAWRIFAAFEAPAWCAAHPRLDAYLARTDAVVRHELALQVAALFDQYITYRPEWLARWAESRRAGLHAGANPALLADEAWQAALWRRLSAEIDADAHAATGAPADAVAGAPSAGVHPATAFAEAIAARGAALVADGTLPAEVHVFALPAMPPLHLGLLQVLAGCVDVRIYAINPCREYWLEVVDRRRLAYLARRAPRAGALHHEEGHRLLASWGRQTKAQLELLVDAGGDTVIDEAHFDAPAGGHLLAQLQRSILEMTDLAPGAFALGAGDRSIEVHVCHSLTRELEVLHDRLLALFGAADAPRPGDILVVTPDLDAAAPLIDAVFGTAPAARRIAYRVTGRARSSVNAPASVLLELLALAASRCTASAVFGLLQRPIVARRFGLDDDGLARIHAWLQGAGVHWALDGEQRAAFGLPAQARHSFADGVERLYLGYALPDDVDRPFGAQLPAGGAEGSQAVALGALWRFVEALAALRREVCQPRPAADWPALLIECLQRFVAPLGDELEDLREVQAAIESLADELRRAAPALPLSLDVLRSALARALDEVARGGVPTGAVTFAAMNSLRGLPFKVVCAIGLNDGAFPTAQRPAEFDLLARDPRPGDRQRRTDERNLFLDLLLAAREHFHLSYAGHSVRDNAALPPSTLVSELLETLLPAIAGDAAAARARLVVAHPLQAFSDLAFRADGDPRLRSFDAETARALQQRLDAPAAGGGMPPAAHGAEPVQRAGDIDGADAADDEAGDSDGTGEALPRFFAAPLAPPGEEWCEVSLDDLIAFFANPCRYLLRRRLGIALARAEAELQDDEPFVAGVPARGALAARLLPALRAGAGVEAARELALAGTEVPEGAFGRHFLDRELDALARFAQQVNALTAAPVLAPHAVSVELPLDGRTWRLRAGFADLRATGLARHRYDALRARDVLDAWLHHLLLCADPPPGATPRTLWQARDECLELAPRADARALLRELVALYARGLREPLYFFPKAAWAYMRDGESMSAAAGAWRVTPQRPFGESADPAYRLALRGLPDPMAEGWDAFEACARAVFGPLLAAAPQGAAA